MTLEKALNATSVVKFMNVKIDEFEIPNDDIISMEIKQDFFGFGIIGNIKIKDSYDLSNNGIIDFNGVNKITVSTVDFFENQSFRTYRITNTKGDQNNDRFKVMEFDFQDEITFILKNSYVSKSFTDKPVNALKKYLTFLGIDDLMTTDRISYNFDDVGTSRSFVVPQDVSVLDFFLYLFSHENIRFWQDRNGLYVKEVKPAELSPLLDENSAVEYTNSVGNNNYKFKIHDYNEIRNPSVLTNQVKPKEKTYRYDYTKEIVDTTTILSDELDNFKVNAAKSNDMSSLQQTNGERYTTQSIYETGNQTYDLFNTYMNNNVLQIVVPGSLKYSNIGNVANVVLKGNPIYAKSSIENDELSSGRYFIGSVSDRYIGGKMINRLGLNRVDSVKPGVLR